MSKAAAGCLLLIFLVSYSGLTQDRYFVYFKNKNSANSLYGLNDPEAFLSQKSIGRREKQSIALDSTDLPVSPDYVARVTAKEVDAFFTSKWLNGVLVEMDSSQADTIRNLMCVDRVRLVALGTRLRAEPEQWNPPINFSHPPYVDASTNVQLSMLGADDLAADSVLGQGVTIAVFDNGFTGVDEYEPFRGLWEESRIMETRDFVENSGNVFQYGAHGSSVFSIMAADYHFEEADFTGIANKANFVLCVTEDAQAENTIEEYNWVMAAEFADSLGVDIINSSLGYRDFDLQEHDYDYEDLDGETAVISKAARLAARKGIIVVTSSGNSGRRNEPANLINHPADADSILTVGSVDPDFTRSSFSSIGPTADGRIKPDVCAFGNGTALVRGDGGIERGSGTSFASPLIAGLAAAVWQKMPEKTAQEIINEIRKASHKSANPDKFLGYGVPYYAYIINEGGKAINIDEVIAGNIEFYPNPFTGDTLFLRSVSSPDEEVTVKVVDPLGKVVLARTFLSSDFQQILEIPLEANQQGIYYLFLQSGKDQKIVKLLNF